MKKILPIALLFFCATAHAEENPKQKAWEMIAQVVSQYRGTLQEHQTIQRALEVLKPKVNDEATPVG